MQPRPDRRQIAIEDVAAGVELQDGAVIVVGGPGRADERDLVHHLTHMREPVAHQGAGLRARAVPALHRVKRQLDLVLAGHERLQVLFHKRILERVLIRRFGKLLSRVLIQGRFGIERLDVADAAEHEEPDDPLGLGLEVWLAIGRRPGILGGYTARQQCAQHQAGKAERSIGQKDAPGPAITTKTIARHSYTLIIVPSQNRYG
jgi:hypothetical protein